jgi:hypothetical protein
MDIERLIDTERGFWTGDAVYCEANTMPETLFAFAPTGVIDRAAALDGLRSAPRWTAVDFEDVRVVRLAEDVTLLTYAAAARRDGDARRSRAIATSVYVRHGDAWTLSFHQQTPLERT